ncbi:MAG: lysylphosphatidylglycerol synthase domain-containing protein [Chloroflexota bacterium]
MNETGADPRSDTAASAGPATPAAPSDPDPTIGTDTVAAAAPPSRRAALMRSGLIVGVLLVVFGVILPATGVNYSEVLAAFRALTPDQVVVITVLGAIAWLVSGLVFCALIPGLSVLRGPTSWLILAGIGASIPFGPWNMGVLWVVVRGWGIPNIPATSGIALYGIVNMLSRLFLPLFAIITLAATGDLAGKENAGRAWTIAIVSAVAFIVAVVLIVAIVRSEKVADWLGQNGQRLAAWVMHRLGRNEAPDVSGAIHRFRDQLGVVIRRRGLAAMATSIASQFAWVLVLTVALRMCGVPADVLTPGIIFGVYSLVMVITIIPLSPGGAGVPELLFIAGLTAIAGEQYTAAITAGVFLYRLYFWFVPIPLAWILLKVARRGKPMLPTTAELRASARGDAA